MQCGEGLQEGLLTWRSLAKPMIAHVLACRHALDVTGAPEPSDVQYENMEHGGFDRFLRAALVAACSYSALAVGFVLISLASAMRYNLPQVCVCVCLCSAQLNHTHKALVDCSSTS